MDEKKEVESVIASTKPHDFSCWDRLVTKFLTGCCCCFRQTTWYAERKRRDTAHRVALDRISSEIDIFNFVHASRALKLLTSVILRKN